MRCFFLLQFKMELLMFQVFEIKQGETLTSKKTDRELWILLKTSYKSEFAVTQ